MAETAKIERIQHQFYCSGTTSLNIMDEAYKTAYAGVPYKKLSPYVEVFNEILAKMEPNGMMEYWRRFKSFSTTKIEQIGPQVLTLDHLKIGFLACCIPMVLAVIAFIGELAWSSLSTPCKNNSND